MTSELKVEAPLATLDDSDEWQDMTSYEPPPNESSESKNRRYSADQGNTPPEFTDTLSYSLEDLVNTFDDKVTDCFRDYQQSVEQLAPVQLRSQEDVMNDCQMWWTITGNFGNILPIDWSSSQARKLHLMPALHLASSSADMRGPNEEEDDIERDLDLHSLILSSPVHQSANQSAQQSVKTADQVIKEIDDIIQEDLEKSPNECAPTNAGEEGSSEVDGGQEYLKLQSLNVSQLNEAYLELELLIKELSETLISELASRDELEYEKELKNSFISLVLSVQNRRRQYHTTSAPRKRKGLHMVEPKYLTTVIPYHANKVPLDNHSLQVVIKILKAINDDSPAVPPLLTDYILKVLCP